MTLDELKPTQSAYICSVGGNGALRRHLLDMGLTPKAEVTLQKIAPMGDPVQIELRGYELTLRLDEAQKITVENLHTKAEKAHTTQRRHAVNHPGVGELGRAGKRRSYGGANEIPEGEKVTFALVGNQNCGKTTLFNQLTGANQHVGNFPGVTVDRKDGSIRKHPEAIVTDLPGIYSLSPYSSEEIVTRDFLIDTHPDGIINIVDATNMERNLYLTMQLMELDIPMVLALNMMDEVRANGGSVQVNELEEILGIPVIPISAAKNEGIEELIDHALHVARHRESPGRVDFCLANNDEKDPVGAVHRCIHAAAHILEPEAKEKGLPVRFTVTKLVENDHLIKERLHISPNKLDIFEHLVSVMEAEAGLDREAALANMRFTFIEALCEKTLVRPHESKEHRRSMAIDRILTGKYTAIPCFIGIMALVFAMIFNFIGAALTDLFAAGIDAVIAMLDGLLTNMQVNPVIHSLVIDGVCSGVGSVLSLLPTIVTMFFFLSILEDTGYIARVAFVMDRLLRKIGLSGRSIVPMLIGFGCSVPAIMSTRTLSSERDRKMTILLVPFMSCTAKLPIYSLMIGAFFPRKYQALVMIGLYVLGMVCGILYALLLKGTKYKGEPVPFVMELPNYRFPSAKSVWQLIMDKSKDFVKKAFTVIFVASLAVWFLQTFDIRMNVAASPEESLLAAVGGIISPLFKPLGFGDWRVSTALIAGFSAKESVVSTLTVLLGGDMSLLGTLFTPFTAFVFLVFTLLYTPCVAAVAAARREIGSVKGAAGIVLMQCVIAWVIAFLVRGIGLALGLA